jgi:protein-S-isoprenylcysteine O-methyltransferase Ste14
LQRAAAAQPLSGDTPPGAAAAAPATSEPPQPRSLKPSGPGRIRGFLVFGQVVPATVFFVLLGIQAQAAVGLWSVAFATHNVSVSLDALNRSLGAVFLGLLVLLYLVRPQPRRSRRDMVAVAVAFTGSFILLTVPLVSAAPNRLDLLGLADAAQALGLVTALWGLMTLRFSFSILPEARQLVTGGPYRVVRHPVYLGEFMSAAGLLAPRVNVAVVVVAAIFVGAQLTRMHWEEGVLTAEFPEYAPYSRRTRRLIPFIY